MEQVGLWTRKTLKISKKRAAEIAGSNATLEGRDIIFRRGDEVVHVVHISRAMQGNLKVAVQALNTWNSVQLRNAAAA